MSESLLDAGAVTYAPGHYLFDAQGRIVNFTAARVPPAPTGSGPLQFSPSANFSQADLQTEIARQVRTLLLALPDVAPHACVLAPECDPASARIRFSAYSVSVDGRALLAVILEPDETTAVLSSDAERRIGLSSRQLAALLVTSSALHAGETLQIIFQALAREAKRLIPFDRASISLLKEESGEIQIFPLPDGIEDGVQAGTLVPAEDSATHWVVKHRQPVVTHDMQVGAKYKTYPEMMRSGYRSALCYPLVVEGAVLGTLNFTSRKPNCYSPDLLAIIEPLAQQSAIAILNVRLRAQLMSESQRLKRIINVSNNVKHHLSPEFGYLSVDAILNRICRTACELGWERAILTLRKENSDGNFISAFAGDFPEPQLADIALHHESQLPVPGFSTTPGARQSGVHRRIGDHSFWLGSATDTSLRRWHGGDIVVVPLANEGKLFGTLSVDRQAGSPRPNAPEVETLEMLADQAMIVLHNARLIAALQNQLSEVKLLREQDRVRSQKMQNMDKLRALGELASGVAHNFNNALTIIQGRVGLLKMRATDEKTLHGLDIIQQVSRDAANIVRRIQDFARVRQDVTDFTLLNLSVLVREVIEVTQPQWKNSAQYSGRDITVACEAPPALHIHGNATELREVLTNLIFNAVDAMPDGGQISIRAYEANGCACLQVSDPGTGMSDEVRQRIFDPFYSTKGGQGTGMGLSVSFNIVTRHQGNIQVESEPGRGTTFLLNFPLASTARPPRAPEPPANRQPHSLRILIVDDERAIGEMLCEMLSVLHHNPHFEENPVHALVWLANEPCDVLFTDLGMPGLNGWQMITEARRLRPRLPVVLISGWAASLNPTEVKAHRARLISKPIDLELVERTLAEIVEESRLHAAESNA
jgi:signal transduction histidine kinase/CheY-like chemotaxis protein